MERPMKVKADIITAPTGKRRLRELRHVPIAQKSSFIGHVYGRSLSGLPWLTPKKKKTFEVEESGWKRE
jgi:hypothetical protein